MGSMIQRMNATGLLTLLLAGCWGPGAKPPDVKMNASPQERYEITLTVQDPPAAIQKVEGSIQFNIEDTSCMPTADRIAGVQPKSSFERPVEFKRTRENIFTGYIYTDWLQDENYYRRGMCRWTPTGVISTVYVGKAGQSLVLRGEHITNEGKRVGLCSRVSTVSDICVFPIDGVVGRNIDQEFIATIESRRMEE